MDPYKRRGKAMAWVMSGFSLASVIGVPLGLVINDYFSRRMTFYFIGVIIFLSSIACYFELPEQSIPSKGIEGQSLSKFLGQVLKTPNIYKFLDIPFSLVE